MSDVRRNTADPATAATVAIVDDRAIVAALVSGDPRGLEDAYRLYADRLHTFCRSLLHDPDAAADAVHDTFVIASQRAGQLREPDRLRAWLYAIARNECLRSLRARARQVPLEEVGDVSAPPTDPGRSMRAEEVRELVWAAAVALNPGDRQVFELMVQHELSAADVGAVLGISADHAHARLSRARAQLERALGALLVARTGAADCPELARLLHGWNGVLTALLRKRVSRHVEGCATCADRQHAQLRPQNLLSAYAALPLLAAPVRLWPRTRLTCTEQAHEPVREALDRRAGRFDRSTGFPRPLDAPGRGGRSLVTAAAAAVVLLLVLGGALVFPRLGGGGPATQLMEQPTSQGSAAPTPQAAHAQTAGPSLVAPPVAATQTPSRSVNPPPPAVTPTSSASSTPPVPPPTVSAVGRLRCDDGRRYLVVSVRAEGGTINAAELYWTTRFTAHEPMTVDQAGTSALLQVGPFAATTVTWWVEVTAAGGGTVRTSPFTQSSPC